MIKAAPAAWLDKLADEANKFVGDHRAMLESTGLVRWQQMPPAAIPAAQNDSLVAAAQAGAAGPSVAISTTVVWAVFLLALGAGGYATWRITRRS